ncbi:MAG: methylated-DNA--[protein]-cysteine S-methyltransferase [Bacteroidota bacterium]
MEKTYIGYCKSPVGMIEITGSDVGITSINFIDDHKIDFKNSSTMMDDVVQQLKEYFEGSRKEFDMKLDLQGTEFQLQVWQELMKIPYGKTISYLQLAKRIGNPKSIRAAATANGKNPISIVVPCHRIIGADGKLVGYSGGLSRKEFLLKLENKLFGKDLFS